MHIQREREHVHGNVQRPVCPVSPPPPPTVLSEQNYLEINYLEPNYLEPNYLELSFLELNYQDPIFQELFQLELSNLEQNYLVEDLHKFQMQLYQELQYQVTRQDMQKDIAFLCGESISGTSTLDTPHLNTVFIPTLDVPQVAMTSNYIEAPMLSNYTEALPKRMLDNPTNGVQKKHTRKHVMARSRSGCWICRIKHLKCDESKPSCGNCTRFGIQCDYSAHRPDYVSNQVLRRQKLDAITAKKKRAEQ